MRSSAHQPQAGTHTHAQTYTYTLAHARAHTHKHTAPTVPGPLLPPTLQAHPTTQPDPKNSLGSPCRPPGAAEGEGRVPSGSPGNNTCELAAASRPPPLRCLVLVNSRRPLSRVLNFSGRRPDRSTQEPREVPKRPRGKPFRLWGRQRLLANSRTSEGPPRRGCSRVGRAVLW